MTQRQRPRRVSRHRDCHYKGGIRPASTTAASSSTMVAFRGRTCSTARRCRRGRHLPSPIENRRPAVFHHARHADPRPGHGRRQRWRARLRVALDIATRYGVGAQAVRSTRCRPGSADHGLPGASAPAVPLIGEVLCAAVRAERAGGKRSPASCGPSDDPDRRGAARAGAARGPEGRQHLACPPAPSRRPAKPVAGQGYLAENRLIALKAGHRCVHYASKVTTTC